MVNIVTSAFNYLWGANHDSQSPSSQEASQGQSRTQGQESHRTSESSSHTAAVARPGVSGQTSSTHAATPEPRPDSGRTASSASGSMPPFPPGMGLTKAGLDILNFPDGKTASARYKQALTKAVHLSENRITFGQPNALVQFIKKKQGLGEEIDAHTLKSILNRTAVKKDFKNDEIFSNYKDNAWVVKDGISMGELLDEHLFGPKKPGTKYYLDCAEYAQVLQLYALYHSASPEEKKELFETGEPIKISSFESTGLQSKSGLRRSGPDEPFVNPATGEKANLTDRELFDALPIGSRVTFTNRESSANNTDFKNENTVKVARNAVAALGFEDRILPYDDLKLHLAIYDESLVNRIFFYNPDWPEVEDPKDLTKEQKDVFASHVYISEAAVFDTPQTKDFNL
ncbi:hypothetical protein [Vibrio mangrovi]|uniref:Uncharacterized protein n=1 Tax=Vibrio mangrovi TaxID=474394 RepID=A0A1Y6ISP8_9VIBR|nr:hypothetical protein [Vibrio mangrovi]MDW6005528.1 hypothetical protein [Vibrio mangrovi]SMS00697.1 hypothetical protein VIM7927_01966 [Vibrio mangrovi]